MSMFFNTQSCIPVHICALLLGSSTSPNMWAILTPAVAITYLDWYIRGMLENIQRNTCKVETVAPRGWDRKRRTDSSLQEGKERRGERKDRQSKVGAGGKGKEKDRWKKRTGEGEEGLPVFLQTWLTVVFVSICPSLSLSRPPALLAERQGGQITDTQTDTPTITQKLGECFSLYT